MPRNKILFCALAIFLTVFCSFVFAGTVELTTYYPAPAGEYDDLESNKLKADGSCVGAGCTDADVSNDELKVKGTVVATGRVTASAGVTISPSQGLQIQSGRPAGAIPDGTIWVE